MMKRFMVIEITRRSSVPMSKIKLDRLLFVKTIKQIIFTSCSKKFIVLMKHFYVSVPLYNTLSLSHVF